MVKYGLALAGLAAAFIMEQVGFDSKATTQTTEALTGLRIAYIALPVSGTLLAMVVMSRYSLDEARSREIREAIEARRAAAAAVR